MDIYKSSKQKIAGTSFSEINKTAKAIFNRVKARTRRTPYLRSRYFKKEKVFLNLFWNHLYKKKTTQQRHLQQLILQMHFLLYLLHYKVLCSFHFLFLANIVLVELSIYYLPQGRKLGWVFQGLFS